MTKNLKIGHGHYFPSPFNPVKPKILTPFLYKSLWSHYNNFINFGDVGINKNY
jgi:hypothetical protein